MSHVRSHVYMQHYWSFGGTAFTGKRMEEDALQLWLGTAAVVNDAVTASVIHLRRCTY